uniref:Exostosin GT47 domain-containing protein n=1 Tax=Tetraselmis sp. GSL018 TaxID=582737 RepID=A0A061RN34_9CHLO|eukprot:CAMPEP_0177578556 /NCGR_PEP_ID=MMETSP0419_2-20121207/417_1 /TAXON_ID=582737 /ORGANISM="Tetraselmis sp., Strain GSL018" /LENGTH=380 /DNA_ID=CAMNT_0019067019 /DNA_START=1146 /DNA_END=2288 /DNA_ORIENTATION=+
MNPDEANLFVVPAPFTLSYNGFCGSHTQNIETLAEFIESSKYFQRREGRDHLILATNAQAKLNWQLYHRKDSKFPTVTRNFIFGTLIAPDGLSHGLMRDRPPRGKGPRCSIKVPVSSSHGFGRCKIEGGQLLCPRAGTELSFDSYVNDRNTTLFFMGHTQRDSWTTFRQGWADKIHRSTRELIVTSRIEMVFKRSVLIGTQQARKDKSKNLLKQCKGKQLAGCAIYGGRRGLFSKLLMDSWFSIHAPGDDSASARVWDAFAVGTPQLIIADRYFKDVAPFKCKVPWHRVAVFINERLTRKNPKKIITAALKRIIGDHTNRTLWKLLWESQAHAADDVLWHTPESRVANNIIEDAARYCLDAGDIHINSVARTGSDPYIVP